VNKTGKEKLENGIKIVLDTFKKGKVILGQEKRKSKDRRKSRVTDNREFLGCRYLLIKDTENNIGHCKLFKRDIILPNVCKRCSSYISKSDRRIVKDRRKK